MIEIIQMNIPHEVYQLVAILKEYNPLLVGGCVRDYLMGNKPHDYDLVVQHVHHQMLLEIIEAGWQTKLTENNGTEIWNVTKKFPIYDTIYYKGSPINYVKGEKSYVIELLSYRGETLSDDASSRDLTINSLYYDYFNDKIFDPTGRGLEDIQNKVVRFNNKQVVEKDPLRIMRAYRFAKKFDFTIEDKSLKLCRNGFDSMIKEISPTRILKEIEKLCL